MNEATDNLCATVYHADQDYRRKRDWWWQTVMTLNLEWSLKPDKVGDFYEWMSDTHGVKMLRDNQGNILGDYDISDEKKHLVFILKYL